MRNRPDHVPNTWCVSLPRSGPPSTLLCLSKRGVEHDVELTAGIDDAPRLHRRVPVVLPTQLVAELVQAAVDDDAVLGEAGAVGPLRTELQADDVRADATGAAAPVPSDVVRPTTAADVEHTPRVAGRAADLPPAVTDDELAARGAGLMLRREVELRRRSTGSRR